MQSVYLSVCLSIGINRVCSDGSSRSSFENLCFSFFLHCALSLAAQCIVIGPVCGFATGGAGGVCYHDNSKLRAPIFTKLGL